MVLSAIIISIIFALGFSLLLSYAFKREGPGPVNGLIFIATNHGALR